MSPTDLLFAAMLLSAPVGAPEVPPVPERWPVVRDSLRQTAVEWEILDPRETGYVLAKLEDFQEDLNFLRKRRGDLREAPRVVESNRLPDRETINNCIKFNRSFKTNMEMRILWEADRADFIREVINENERLYKIWDAIRDAKSSLHYVTTRRLALQKLRDIIGPDAYASGDAPPYVPEWRFTHVP
jgi:hypothetical protein